MPPRTWVVAITVFWLVTVGWLYQRDLWPRLRSDEPAPFSFDLADEARIEMNDRPLRSPLGAPFKPEIAPKGQTRPVQWGIQRNGEDFKDYTETRVLYRRRDHTLEQISELKLLPNERDVVRLNRDVGNDPLVRVECAFHINWNGELLDVMGDIWVRGPGKPDQIKMAQFDGVVRDGQLIPQWWIDEADGRKTTSMGPVPLSNRGGILSTSHPPNRIIGLKVGQHWTVPLLDLMSVVRTRTPQPVLQLEAQVDQDELGRPPNQTSIPCYLVTYRHQGSTCVRTWVQQSDGLVLRYEVLRPGDRLLFERGQ